MGITDELRKWAEDNTLKDRVLTTCPPQHAVHGVLETLLRIADRIDAEYQKAIRELNNLAEASVLLPVDADGEYVRIGDVMENIVCPSVHREVTGVGVECFYGWDENNGRYSQLDVNCYRHHHEPTVEDVLRDLVAAYMDTPLDDSNDGEFFAEYAAKLRLAGDAE